MPSRTNTHAIETRSCDLCRIIINSYFENGDALVRELTGKDYGVDFLLELFSNGFPTGNIAFLQIKGTVQDIDENKSYVFCPGVTCSSLRYALQNKIPVFLIYVFIKKKTFYFIKMQDIDVSGYLSRAEKKQNKCVSVYIPTSNNSNDNLVNLFSFD